MVLAGGTSTAWHIASVVKEYFAEEIYLIICDINDRCLVHTATLADEYIKVLPIEDKNYYEQMLYIFDKKQVDILVPLIDYDIFMFYRDNDDLIQRHILSTAPEKDTTERLSNKRNMSLFLRECGIITPRIFELSEISLEKEYFVKDEIGFGSRGARRIKGKDIVNLSGKQIIQELCDLPEVTVDVVNSNGKIYSMCRERIEIKLGVCTKAKVFYDEELQKLIELIAKNINLPEICCVQFMKDSLNRWTLIDFNLRSGGGTALSAATGYQAVRAAINMWCGISTNIAQLLPQNFSEKRYVVRTYREVLTK